MQLVQVPYKFATVLGNVESFLLWFSMCVCVIVYGITQSNIKTESSVRMRVGVKFFWMFICGHWNGRTHSETTQTRSTGYWEVFYFRASICEISAQQKKNVFKFIKSFHTGLNLHSDLILISNGVMNWSWSRNTSCHSSKKHSVSFRTQLLLKPSCKKQLVLYFISVWCNSVMKDCLCNAYFYIIHVVGGE